MLRIFSLLLSCCCLLSSCAPGTPTPQAAEAKPAFITRGEAWEKIHAGALLLDVRSPDEFRAGHLEGALNIPHDEIQKHAAELAAAKDKEIVLYCRSGRRSGIALETLKTMGFTKLYNAGGYSSLIPQQ